MSLHSRFALIGAAGYVAPRHMRAIADAGNELVAALDPHDAVGVLDKFGRDVHFFTEPERFERHLRALRRAGNQVDWLSVCSPNYLHDVHVTMGLDAGANVICEKPLVLSPWNLDALADEEQRTGRRVFTVLQLRLHPALLALKAKLDADPRHREAVLTYHTPRGRWYHQSWKGDRARSGGLLANIGVHLFDLVLWLFGGVERAVISGRTDRTARGRLELARGYVSWELSVEGEESRRELRVGDEIVRFDDGFTDLHTEVYRRTLLGRGWGIEDARPSVELVHRLG